MPTTLCNKLHVALWTQLFTWLFFGQQTMPKIDSSRSIHKRRLVKQSTLVVALSILRHCFGCICTAI